MRKSLPFPEPESPGTGVIKIDKASRPNLSDPGGWLPYITS
jgi:hypothetical protein